MSKKLDLVLITDEPIAWEGDYWKRSSEKLTRQMRALSITREDKERVEEEYPVKDYFRPLPKPEGDENAEDLYRIRVPHRPHLSLCDLSTVVVRAGYSVRVVDNVMRFPSRMDHIKKLLADEPLAVGISTTFLLAEEQVRYYVEMIKELAPNSKLILGGPSIRKLKHLHGICDFAVFGDGEEAIVAILDVLHGKRSPETIPNSSYTLPDGAVKYGVGAVEASRIGQSGKPYKALQVKIPVADWGLSNRSPDNVFAIEFSRGCIKTCNYCSYDRGKNIRDLGEIKEELIRNAEMGITKYRVSDSNFTDGPPNYPDYPNDICKLMIELDLGLEWSCYARVDDMSEELSDLMKRAGCFGVFFGIESGDDRILKLMNKRHTVADAYEGVRLAKKYGLFSHASFIVGYPGENEESFLNTIKFIEKSRPDTVNLGQFRVEHDTPVYGIKEFELEGLGMEWKHKTMNSKEADELVVKGNERLLENGVCLGTECSFPTFMGLGLTMDESFQTMNDLDLVGLAEKAGCPEYECAVERLRDKMLNRFPKYIMEDQLAWEGSYA